MVNGCRSPKKHVHKSNRKPVDEYWSVVARWCSERKLVAISLMRRARYAGIICMVLLTVVVKEQHSVTSPIQTIWNSARWPELPDDANCADSHHMPYFFKQCTVRTTENSTTFRHEGFATMPTVTTSSRSECQPRGGSNVKDYNRRPCRQPYTPLYQPECRSARKRGLVEG